MGSVRPSLSLELFSVITTHSPMQRFFFLFTIAILLVAGGHAQETHQHGASTRVVKKPKVFLDKSPRVVAYQLKRLRDSQLLLVDREPTDPKYVPVYEAILQRESITPKEKLEAAQGLATLRQSTVSSELLSAVELQKPDQIRSAKTLIRLLLSQPPADLEQASADFQSGLESKTVWQRAASAAALTMLGQDALDLGAKNVDWLVGISLIPDASIRDQYSNKVADFLAPSKEMEERREAIKTIARIKKDALQHAIQLVEFLDEEGLRQDVIRTLLKLPVGDLPAETAASLSETLVRQAESTPKAKRTADNFVRGVELIEKTLVALPSSAAKPLRARLREVAVRLVRVGTVEEEMRYDIKYFAVEAGTDVQIILDNHDLMPHNLVITQPGKLKQVAADGLAVGPSGGKDGKGYVPDNEDVLYATSMVAAHQSERLTFTAPSEPGNYPYVCTFPQHWSRMYGVMVVVDDLDAWLANPVEPEDPIGSNRSFVAAWTVDDLKADLVDGLRGRSPAIGKKLFVEASCATCHKMAGQGGAVGPELTNVFPKWKGDAENILREILDPSACIDDKFAMYTVLTVDGQTISGLVQSETDDEITLINDPESGKPTVIPQDDVEELVKMPTSMMPKGLMNQYTRDEILELMAYLKEGS